MRPPCPGGAGQAAAGERGRPTPGAAVGQAHSRRSGSQARRVTVMSPARPESAKTAVASTFGMSTSVV